MKEMNDDDNDSLPNSDINEELKEATQPIGKQWILYINNMQQDWQFICERGRIVSKKDDIIWKYEYAPSII